MERNKLRTYYILSLLFLAILLLILFQNVFSGLSRTSVEPLSEINRIDLYNEFLGNYSKISVMLINNDTVSHNYSISTFYDEKHKDDFNVTVNGGELIKFKRDVLPDRIPVSDNETINSTLKTVKLAIYINEQQEPFEEASFVFNSD